MKLRSKFRRDSDLNDRIKRVGQYHQFNQKYHPIEPPETTRVAHRYRNHYSCASAEILARTDAVVRDSRTLAQLKCRQFDTATWLQH